MSQAYVHGYDPRENTRLLDQAETLAELIHADSVFPAKSRILEAGCGVGAQTLTLAPKNPESHFTSIDINGDSVCEAERKAAAAGIGNVEFLKADIFDAPFKPESFDHALLCFVLEHLPRPLEALSAVKRLIRPGGGITVIEGDHGSAYFHPDSDFAKKAIACQVALQARAGGDANIGRRLYPLLSAAGFESVRVSPRMVYADASRPGLVEGFTKKTFTAMIEGVRNAAVSGGLSAERDFDRGIRDLYRTAEKDGVFCYTFFKATAVKG